MKLNAFVESDGGDTLCSESCSCSPMTEEMQLLQYLTAGKHIRPRSHRVQNNSRTAAILKWPVLITKNFDPLIHDYNVMYSTIFVFSAGPGMVVFQAQVIDGQRLQ